MTKLMQYVSQHEGRDRVIKDVGRFTALGGVVVAIILLSAAYFR